VHSRIEIVALYRSGPGGADRPGTGRTVITSIRAGYHFAARQTGPGVVHLVGTAAGPLGGDDVEVVIRLGPGSALAVRSAGATIVQPAAQRPDSRLRMSLTVAEGAQLDVAVEPTVVIHRAEHEAITGVELAGDGRIRLLEQVILGRSKEPGGSWIGRTRMTRGGAAELRHTLRSALLAGDRVISTLLVSGIEAMPATSGNAVAMPLAAGGLLVTSTGAHALSTRADLLAAAALAGGLRTTV
jgi:urease accessory protein